MSGADDRAGMAGFEEYVAARRAALLRTAYLLAGNHDDAEDLVQVALVKVVPHWRRISDQPDAYVRRVPARESVSRWRARRWRERSVAALPEQAIGGEDVDQRLVLRQALGSLAPRQRAVVVLRYYEGLTETETAETLAIAASTVKSQARDAMARLRVLVPDLDPTAPGESGAPAPDRLSIDRGTR